MIIRLTLPRRLEPCSPEKAGASPSKLTLGKDVHLFRHLDGDKLMGWRRHMSACIGRTTVAGPAYSEPSDSCPR